MGQPVVYVSSQLLLAMHESLCSYVGEDSQWKESGIRKVDWANFSSILSIIYYYVPRISLVKKFFFFFRNWTLFWILIIMLSFQVSTHSLCRNNALCLINELCTEKSLLESQDRTNVILCLTYGTAAARFQQAKI